MTRVGIAGYGLAGRTFHAPWVSAAGLELVAVATSDPGRRAAVETDWPAVDVVPDLQALLARGDLDLVVLASASGVHAAQARSVVEAGLPLVVDKPLAVDAEEALEVVELAEQAGVPLTVYQNRRYDPEFATLREVVRSGAVGRPHRLELRWERWRPVPKGGWREQRAPSEGGGIMLDLQTHLVDAAAVLLGPVESVHASVASWTTASEDDTFLLCRHLGGVVSHLTASSVSAAPGPRVRLLGSEAAYLLARLDEEPETFPGRSDADAKHCGWLYRGQEREPVAKVGSEMADFYRGVAAALQSADPQAGMPVDPRDAVHTLAVIDAARESAADDRVVQVATTGRASA